MLYKIVLILIKEANEASQNPENCAKTTKLGKEMAISTQTRFFCCPW